MVLDESEGLNDDTILTYFERGFKFGILAIQLRVKKPSSLVEMVHHFMELMLSNTSHYFLKVITLFEK